MMVVFAAKIVAAVITALCVKSSTSAGAGGTREEVGEEELSLFMAIATVEGSISDAGEIRELMLERNCSRLCSRVVFIFYFL
jgi:hypothetical protein